MIILVVGDIGSGKSCTLAYHTIKKMQCGFHVYTNFTMKPPKHLEEYWHLLDFSTLDDFEFWKSQVQGNIMIILDEFHNIADSRRSMSKRNIKITHWLAQIRKVLKGHKNNHLIVATQYLRQVDIRIRDLSQKLVMCEFIKGYNLEHDMVINTYHSKSYDGEFMQSHRTVFRPFAIYPYFDTYEIIDFGTKQM